MIRRPLLVGALPVLAVLAIASSAFACTPILGTTWFDDGSFGKSGPTGIVISAFATGARADTPYRLGAGNNLTPNHEAHGCLDQFQAIYPDVRTSNVRGFIPSTAGTISRPPGEWQICFRQAVPEGASATSPVFFTII